MAEDDIIEISMTRGELREMAADCWHDSAATSAERFLARIDGMRKGRYLVGTWSHLLVEDGRQRERECRIVFEVENLKVIHMDVKRASKWHGSSRIERDDLTDSIVNANAEAIENPEEWDLERSNELPDWVARG